MKQSISSFLTASFSVTDRQALATREVAESTNLYMRKDEAELSDDEKTKYISAVTTLIENKRYNEIVNIHADMSADMHGRNMATGQISRTGVQRFLPWHRAYLLEFEKMLQEIDPEVSIPYWNWTKNQRFPDWLSGLLPTGLINRMGETYDVERYIGRDGDLPDPNDIVEGMNPATHNNYTDFTLFLEGWVPYGAHNQVHVYVGADQRNGPVGEMSTMYSPADPIFWLHHAECDRLWHIWQLTHQDEHASLTGPSAIMNPWNYRYKDLVQIEDLGYTYRSLSLISEVL